ncbi:3-hydroxyacyl-CoA dehydrogenase/enoyl-CoA hydratase family protein [Clostridium sediminicola]|uniref:3-hydroxyacyl-CoA dehydrogenase/enoyl-CoA hydratase family protein n=1 Tax=Clostridium sediminicola TaxID=3114879 RepID=UPI0031F1D262
MNFNINKVAVLGSGVMGAGIAAHIAGAGIPVCLLDIAPRELTEKEKAKGLTLESPKVRNRIVQAGKDRVTNPKNKAIYDKDMGDMIQVGNFTDNMDMLKDCDWVIEVIVENLEIKKNFMKQISEYIKPDAIVSSNTSGVPINEIIKDLPLEFRQRFMGTHFFNPPRYMKLLELIEGNDTLPELVEFIDDFGTKRLGKGIVMAKDTPSFIANRIGIFAMINVVQLAEKYGYSVGKVDQLTGTIIHRPKTGTFRLIDLVGLDLMSMAARNFIEKVKNEKEEYTYPEFFVKLVDMGHFGDKTRQGFYKKVKTEKGNQTLVWDYNKEEYVPLVKEKIEAIDNVKKEANKLKALVFGEAEENKFVWNVIKNILLYSARNIPEIADDYKDVDNAMMWGYNWTKGPFAVWDEIGFEESVKKMKQEGETIPAWIEERLANGQTKFYNESSLETPYITISAPKNNVIKENEGGALVDIGDGVLCLQFKSKSNAITDELIDMMYAAVEEVERNYKGLVIGNQSKNFSVGANLMKVAGLAGDKKWNEIMTFADKLQKANMLLKYCKKPVVAAPYGMTLGGGAEVAMHAHRVTAHAETYMGLVEVGVGLIPAGGGTKELLMRSIEDLGKVSNGEMISHVKKAWETIVMGGKVSSSAHDAIKKGYIRKSDRVVMNKDYLISEAKKEVLALADAGFRPLQKKLIPVLGTNGKALLQYAAISMVEGGFMSEYDAHIANKIAWVLSGGDVPVGVKVTEQQILELEKEAFVSLCGEEKTLQRIENMLKTGRALRN